MFNNFFNEVRYGMKIIFSASKKFFILKLILSFISSLLPYLPLFLWRRLLNSLVVFTNGNTYDAMRTIVILTGLYCAVLLISKFVDSVEQIVTYKYNDEVNYYIDNLMIDKVSSIDLAFFDSSDLNDKLQNSRNILFAIQGMARIIFNIIQYTVKLIISSCLISTLGLWLIPVVIISCLPYIIGDKKIKDANYHFEKEYSKAYRKMEYYTSLFFGNTGQEVKLYNLKGYFIQKYESQWMIWHKAMSSKNIKQCIISGISSVFLVLNELIVYAILLTRLRAKTIAVGDVVYYISIMTQFRTDFTNLCSNINSFEMRRNEIKDIRSFIELEPLLEKGGTLVPKNKPRIEFKNVYFKYPDADNYVLQDCSFIIEPNEIVGLIGLNGAGKSTIVKLLLRFYDPIKGQILLDGIDNREYDIVKLRALFGVLLQDYVQYSFTLRENVALSELTRMNNDEDILKACEQSNVTDFIADWEKGIDEDLTRQFNGEGKELSGGQWQRVSLARAFFRNAPVIILDEPSAALDPIAEDAIFDKFVKLSVNKSAILISHRLSSIVLVDRIMVLENGKIIEQGYHSELLKKNGKYSYLFNLQASKYLNTVQKKQPC